jgi:hypothetical protein
MRHEVIAAVGVICLLALVNVRPAVSMQESAPKQSAESVLESTRKTAETAMTISEQSANRSAESAKTAVDAAQTAMKVTQDSAKEAVDTIKEIYTAIGIIAGIVVAVAAFLGFREVRLLREGGQALVQTALQQSRAEFEEKLNEELEKLKTKGLERIHAATLISLDTTDLLRNLGDYRMSIDSDERSEIRRTMMRQFHDLEANAQALNNDRTLSWIWAQRALMSYYEADWDEALKYQRLAVSANSLHQVDRNYNLAAITARIYSLHRNRDEMLEEAVRELETVLAKGSRWDARNALKDDDLANVFTTDTALKQRFEQKAGLADDGTG